MFAWLGLQAVLLVDVATAIVGIGLVALIPVATIVRAGGPNGYFGDLLAGLAYIRGHAVIVRVLLYFAIVFFLMAPPGYLSPLMVVRTFGEEVWRLTVNELAFGLLSIGLGLCGNVFGWSGSSVAYLIVMLVLGGAVAYFSTTAMTLFQEQVEPEMQDGCSAFRASSWPWRCPSGCSRSDPWPMSSASRPSPSWPAWRRFS